MASPTTSNAVLSRNSPDRKSTRLNSSHTEIYTLSLHDALPIYETADENDLADWISGGQPLGDGIADHQQCGAEQEQPRSEEHTSELQSHRDLHSFPTRRSSDL